MVIEMDGVVLDSEPSGRHKRGRAEGEMQKQRGRRKGKGREPPLNASYESLVLL
jgi:hypothetical protein